MTWEAASNEATAGALYQREWRRRQRAARQGTCAVCRGEFAGKRLDARYCRDACRFRAWRRRNTARAALALAEAARRAAKQQADRDLAASLIG